MSAVERPSTGPNLANAHAGRSIDATSASALCLARFRDAMAWKRMVDEALLPIGMTFTEWCVLEAARVLIRTTGDAVSQNDVAASTGLDRAVVSKAMKGLDQKGLVDRGPDLSARGYRIWLHEKGECSARRGTALIEAVSVNWMKPAQVRNVR